MNRHDVKSRAFAAAFLAQIKALQSANRAPPSLYDRLINNTEM
jgi:hypothetical protein